MKLMNRLVFSEDEKSRGRNDGNKTVLLMETTVTEGQAQNRLQQFFKVGRINRNKTNLYTQIPHTCSQYNLALYKVLIL